MAEKVQFMLSDDAMKVINASASERKRGEWLSNLVITYSSLLHDEPDAEQCGVLERIDSKLRRIEQKLDIVLRQKAE